ncbi:unnamed protein product [Peronospora destructor]|uniref:Uncharacterized protein n=1 Tax=Peronospora destructor TaxID=86335 RepID=A0AAV0VBF4_9STRA|nr:unnamed protein product [Peronospora destructor]
MHVPSEGSSPAKKSPSTKRRLRSKEQAEAGAPAVWIIPDWSTYPVIENFYGHAKRARSSSFYEVMCSPMNATATTTLGESCYNYNKDTEEDEERHLLATVTSRGRRPFGGSFAYSCTTDTSEETGSFGLETESLLLYDREVTMGIRSTNSLLCSNAGYTQWNKMRRTMSLTGGLVPVPRDLHMHK